MRVTGLVGIAAVWLATVGTIAAQAAELVPGPPGFDALVERVLAETATPGVAIGVVLDGRVLFARGFGVRERGRDEPVTPHTRFGIASLSKTFAAVTLARLVDAGHVGWNDRVIDHLSEFRVADPWVTRELRLRDLLSHRSGLDDGDDWMEDDPRLTSQEILARQAFAEQRSPLRTTFNYSNVGFEILGRVIERLTGTGWPQSLQALVLDPLQLTETTGDGITRFVLRENTASAHEVDLPSGPRGLAALKTPVDIAVPHGDLPTWVEPFPGFTSQGVLPWRDDKLRTAGGVISSVHDLARYAQTLLAVSGAGKGFLESATWDAMQQVVMPQADRTDGPSRRIGYGLGWELETLHGRRVIGHGGALLGYSARIALVPDAGLGVVVLANNRLYDNPVATILTRTLLEWHLGQPPTDWLARAAEQQRQFASRIKSAMHAWSAARVPNAPPSHPLAAFAGRYVHPFCGEVTIRVVDEDTLELFIAPGRALRLTHWHYDTFAGSWNPPRTYTGLVNFQLNDRGMPAALVLRRSLWQDATLIFARE